MDLDKPAHPVLRAGLTVVVACGTGLFAVGLLIGIAMLYYNQSVPDLLDDWRPISTIVGTAIGVGVAQGLFSSWLAASMLPEPKLGRFYLYLVISLAAQIVPLALIYVLQYQFTRLDEESALSVICAVASGVAAASAAYALRHPSERRFLIIGLTLLLCSPVATIWCWWWIESS